MPVAALRALVESWKRQSNWPNHCSQDGYYYDSGWTMQCCAEELEKLLPAVVADRSPEQK